MKKAVIALIVLIVVIVVVVVALPFLIPVDRIKQELIAATNEATGRQLAIDGDFSLSIFPTLGLNASKVTFSNAPGAKNPQMASIGNLALKLDLLPLLSGRVQVDEFVLTKPVIHLEKDKAGQANWVFKTGEKTEKKSAEKPSEKKSGGFGISDLNLGDIRIKDGLVSYTDQQAGTQVAISDVNLQLDLKGLDQPFNAKGNAIWNDQKVNIDLATGALRGLLENHETKTTLTIAAPQLAVSYDGAVKTLTPLALGGKAEIETPSVRKLSDWAGAPLSVGETGFGPLKISGDVGVTGSNYSFSNANIAFDEIKGTGDFAVNLAGKVPDIKGKLALQTLDINPYLPPEGEGSGGGGAPKGPAKSGSEKWDTTPIDLSALKSVNATFDLSAEKILVRKVKIGRSVLKTALNDGVLDLGLTELNLYDGTGEGSVHVDARSPDLKITNRFSVKNIQLQPLLTDAADFNKLEGKGKFSADLTTSGKSQADFVSALNGGGNLLFEDGSINGINLAAMARNVTSAFTNKGEAQKTDFAEISGTFKIKNGILTNDDLKLLNPFIRLSGKGTVRLPPKTLDYRIEPKLVASTEGQGGANTGGVAVPILVSGPWDKLTYAPDLAGALKDAASNPEGVKKLIEGVKGGNGGGKDVLEKLKEGEGDAVKGLLDGLLGKKK